MLGRSNSVELVLFPKSVYSSNAACLSVDKSRESGKPDFDLIHRPKDFGDAALLVERREVELSSLRDCPVDGRRERADRNLHRAVHELVAHHQERQKFRQHHRRFGRRIIPCAEKNPSCRAHGHTCADTRCACAKRMSPLRIFSFCPFKSASLAPAADMQRARIHMLQADISRGVRRLSVDQSHERSPQSRQI